MDYRNPDERCDAGDEVMRWEKVMPGIVVILQKKPERDGSRLLKKMLQSMMHESWYVPAMGQNSKLGWFAGSVRVEGSSSDSMPVTNESGDLVLFLAGECVVDSDHIHQLRGKGHITNNTGGDFLIHCYEEHGEDFIGQLNGWFSGVLFDRRQGKALVFNDRYGVHRLYCYEDDNGYYFASEAKALLRVFPSLRSLDPLAIAHYLTFDCVLDDRTYFPRISLLPGGSIWRFQQGEIERRSYFNMEQLEAQQPLPAAQFFPRLEQTFARIVTRYMSGSKIALALTGGLDTRMILASFSSPPANLIALTYGNAQRECIDVKLARAVAAAMKMPHWTIHLDQDFLKNYSTHAAKAIYITDGLAHATNVEGIYLNQLARSFAPIKLTGKFGSQVLGKVRRALRPRPIDPSLIHPDFQPHVHAVANALEKYADGSHLSFILRREIPWFRATATVTEMSQLLVRSPFLDNDLIELLYRAPRENFDGAAFQFRMIQHYNPALMDIRTNKGLVGKPDLLSEVIRYSYKIRGLLDKALCWDTLPYQLHHFITRLDSAVLTPLHLDRFIAGFEHFRQYSRWFRAELADQVHAMLLDPRTLQRPYWNQKQVIRMWHDHLAGRRRYVAEIRKVLTIELIHRTLIEDQVASRQELNLPIHQF